jgi:hypothetical protein
MLIVSQVLVDIFHNYMPTLYLVMCLAKDMVFLVFGEWYEGKRWYKEVISSEQLVEMMCKAWQVGFESALYLNLKVVQKKTKVMKFS